ncbi:MAG: glutathione peroxidase [Candidatus Pelagadaptatus aseana]
MCDVVADRPVLIANTASHCGFTYQYGELETLHQEYKDRGLVVVGFPSNDFRQETDDEAESAKICYVNHGVTFTMTDRVHVKGSEAHPIFQHLGDTQGAPGWNFNKYLVDANGKVVKRFPSSVKPSSKLMRQYIETLL